MKIKVISKNICDYQITLNEDEIRLLHDVAKYVDASEIYLNEWAARELCTFLDKLHRNICHLTKECS